MILTKEQKHFKKNVETVFIELSTICNRQCKYCHRQKVKARLPHYMDLDILLKILYELQQIDYDKFIKLFLFNEPMINQEQFLQAVKYICIILPKMKLRLFSNGDFLTTDILNELILYDNIDYLKLSIHLPETLLITWDNILIEKYLKDKISLFGYADKVIKSNHMEYISYYKTLKIISFVTNYSKIGNEMYKNIPKKIRIKPCYNCLKHFCIDPYGNVATCCEHLNLDNDLYGNILQDTCSNLYFYNENKKEFNNNALKYGIKKAPCTFCTNE